MRSITLGLLLIVALSAGLAASAIAQTSETSNPVAAAQNTNAPAANPAAPANPAPAENPVAVAPIPNAPVANPAPPAEGPNANAAVVNPAAPTNPAPADISATSAWGPSSPVGRVHGAGKMGGHAGKGHLGRMHVGKAGGLKAHSRNGARVKAR
jgi:hypothetical protein